jgi:PST family polysaccharide transporter
MVLKIKAARGVLWSLLEFGGGEGISFLVFLLLARLLAPESFGIVALAGVFVAFVQVFLVQGFMDAVIQREDLRDEHLDTAFWSNQAIAVGFFLLTQVVAGPAAAAFDKPLLEGVLRWLSLVFLSTALISIHQAVLKRQLRFAAFAARAIVGVTTGGIVGIVMAVMGYGVWSLVGQQLANGAVSVVVMWSTTAWRPRLRFSVAAFDDMARFTAQVIGSNLVGFLYRKLDIFVIGIFLDPRQLGYYYLVQRLLMTAGLLTLSTVQSIVLPVLSRQQGEPGRFRQTEGGAVQIVNAIFLPAVVGLGAVSSVLLPFVFGEQWRPAVAPFEIMCLSGFTQAVTVFSGNALCAVGRPHAYLRLSLLQVGLTAAAFLPATRFGINGVAVAFVAVTALVIPFHFYVLRRHAGIDGTDLVKRCLPAVIAGVALIIGVQAVEALDLVAGWPAFAQSVALIAVGAATYLATLTVAARGFVSEVLYLLIAALGRRGATSPRERAAAGGTVS